MKNWYQIQKVLLLILIYCFGICVSANALHSSTQSAQQNNEQHEYLTATSNVVFLYTQQSENSLSVFSEYSLGNCKLDCSDFWITSFSNELLFNATLKQYNNYLKTILIRHRKSDIIFPFHNFW